MPVISHVSRKQRQFEALVRAHSADLYRFALWLCGDDAVAQDLVQETCLRAWRSLDALRDGAAAKAWLLTILRRENARLYERKRLELTQLDERQADTAAWANPERMGSDREVREAMMQLDVKYREPLLLQVLGGFSCKEIAGITEQTPGAVMTQLFRARQQLKTALSDEGVAHGLP